ncbi:MAG: DUF1028 domain-containing protein [Actinobacteria bacterium]|nr:DUF1028 domain-containing protein [Actinomycetota bacterium]
MSAVRGTFSIVAADLAAGEVGCAVQSKYFSVGSVVPWARAGVGAVATQAAGVAAFGEQALVRLAAGTTPEEALAAVLTDDGGRETRQLGIVTADGRAAAFTGAECLEWAGHRVGAGFAVQGNILAGPTVVDELARAFEETVGSLAERLVAALEAGQAAGGDRRGQQSAALVVERVGAAAASREGIDRVCDLRVEDHAEPIVELRRLLGIWQVWQALARANAHYEAREYATGADELRRALVGAEDALVLYNLACYESLACRSAQAVEHLRRAVELEPSYRSLAAGDSDFDPVRNELDAL